MLTTVRAAVRLRAGESARTLCALAGGQPPSRVADERTLWVSYTDPATIRKRLVAVAQQVRERLETLEGQPLPLLIMPKQARVHHGFWFMRFDDAASRDAAHRLLHDSPFTSACGTLRGTLQVDEGTKPLDLRGMLNVEAREPDPIGSWLHRKFSPYGRIDLLRLPRLRNNWDYGFGYIHYAEADAAEAALDALDGTPSPVVGCNMYIDFATHKPLYEVRDLLPRADDEVPF